MTKVIRDLAGHEITEGVTVAVAVTVGRSASLRIGKVVEVIPEKERQYGGTIEPKLRVEWQLGYWAPEKSTVSTRDALIIEKPVINYRRCRDAVLMPADKQNV